MSDQFPVLDQEDPQHKPAANPAMLTGEERAVLDLLAKAYEAFNALPVQHPMHGQEFCHGLHECQRLVMSRPVARAEGWVTPIWTLRIEPPPEKRYFYVVLEAPYDGDFTGVVKTGWNEEEVLGWAHDRVFEEAKKPVKWTEWVKGNQEMEFRVISSDRARSSYTACRFPVG